MPGIIGTLQFIDIMGDAFSSGVESDVLEEGLLFIRNSFPAQNGPPQYTSQNNNSPLSILKQETNLSQ